MVEGWGPVIGMLRQRTAGAGTGGMTRRGIASSGGEENRTCEEQLSMDSAMPREAFEGQTESSRRCEGAALGGLLPEPW